MTEIQLKKTLRDFDIIQKKIKLQKQRQDIYGNAGTMPAYKNDELRAMVIADVMDILCMEEVFVIQTHLIEHHTWTETTELFSKKYGREKERSERTLKRIQNRAVKKMLDFINSLPAVKTIFDYPA